jgi:energy-coupling factor transport system substrate-specific component
VSWQVASLAVLALVLLGGFLWYERERPPARVLALVASLAALAVVGRLAFAALPNVKPTTDIVMFAGYALGGVPGFAVGAVTALVSNIFLSQGPWTAWQMVGWGGVGAAAALLARAARGRELGRIPLSFACGFAGLAFGAWMDLYQWTLAARQDLDSYLAVSASSLPYNLAHAIGNVVFCLLIGPLFIRALRRYRRRFEVRWEPAPAAGVAAALVLALAVAAATDVGGQIGVARASLKDSVPYGAQKASAKGISASGGAVASDALAASVSGRAARYLLRAQNRDGGFGGAPGQASAGLHTGWAALGLASARRNPRDVRQRGGRTITAYLKRHARSVRDIGEIERTVMVLRAAGLSPRRFAGRDLVAAIEARRRGDGSIAGYVSYTAFGVMALKAARTSPGTGAVAYLRSGQHDDGGFGVAVASASDTDMTGAVLQALAAAGGAGGDVERRAVNYLRGNQNPDGGFGPFPGSSSNAQSTAYAVQGLVAARAPADLVDRAIAYLRGLQRPDGSIRYSRTSAQTPVWVTAQALAALRRKPLPLGTVPRKRRKRGAAAATAPQPRRSSSHRKRSTGRRAHSGRTAPAAGADRRVAGAAARWARLHARRTSAAGGAATTAAPADRGQPLPTWLVACLLTAVLALLFLLRRWLRGRRRPVPS